MKSKITVIKKQADANKKPEIEFKKFLDLCKSNKRLSNDGIDKGGYTKIRVAIDNDKSKIIFYAKSSKKFGTICWNTVLKKNMRISTQTDFDGLIKTLPIL